MGIVKRSYNGEKVLVSSTAISLAKKNLLAQIYEEMDSRLSQSVKKQEALCWLHKKKMKSEGRFSNEVLPSSI